MGINSWSNPSLIFPIVFLRFKGLGSLSNISRTFALRRASVVPSTFETHKGGILPSISFLEPHYESTQDDLNAMPKSPSPYARSCDMYSHMGTMPRAHHGRSGNQSKAKPKETDEGRRQGAISPAAQEAGVPMLRKEGELEPKEKELTPSKAEPSPASSPTGDPITRNDTSVDLPEDGQVLQGSPDKMKQTERDLPWGCGEATQECVPNETVASGKQVTEVNLEAR